VVHCKQALLSAARVAKKNRIVLAPVPAAKSGLTDDIQRGVAGNGRYFVPHLFLTS
jgi:hypothetical protein